MFWDELSFSLRANWLLPSVAALIILQLLYSHYIYPLRKYKGPLLASFTELWGVWIGWTGQDPSWLVSLHSKHGKVVRIAPNVLSFGQPDAIKDIYMSGFHKVCRLLLQKSVVPLRFLSLCPSFGYLTGWQSVDRT